MKLYMTNGVEMKTAPVGFSWTTFFFGFFPALFRADWKWFLIQFIIALITSGLSTLVFMFIYNKLYIRDLIEKGYKVMNVEGGTTEMAQLKLGFVSLPTVAEKV